MQKAVRVNEAHLLLLATRARFENTLKGNLHKKGTDTGKWRQRWFVLWKNLLFYYDSDVNPKLCGVVFLEGCHCERTISGVAGKGRENEKQYCFELLFQKDGHHLFELCADTESECSLWISAILKSSFSKILEHKEQLNQKHNHLLQILDTERQAKWNYVQQTEELTIEVKNLKTQIQEYRRDRQSSNHTIDDQENEEIKKIKKVQSFFRGWMCRRRWKQIVELYICSDHAESMRKRNSIVFGMVEREEEYVKQLSTLVSVFLRPFRMAASSKKPPILHEDVNSIFLNSETLQFLHQIFLKGLVARMENWPTLVLGDLFDMLLPMLGIYQEYVRNHHYSLQVLAEYKQKPDFNQLLGRCENKTICEGHSLEIFLTYPMHQIPHYIITIHNILAHTVHDHVERCSLEYAKSKLEELSQVMQDEISETENIRKNLAIERMIVQGCDILLDVEQTFIRQGSLIQVTVDKSKLVRLGSFSSAFKESRKENVRQVFLFTHHMLLSSRTSNGRLHLAKFWGKIPLIDCTLVEDAESINYADDDNLCSEYNSTSAGSLSTLHSIDKDSKTGSLLVDKEPRPDLSALEFRVIIDSKSGSSVTILLMASTVQEKAAWCSDIAQCIENLHYSEILNCNTGDTSSVTLPQSVRSDPRLFRDNTDIKFSRTLNSCKVPQIRHASLEKILDRLTDLRFLSIDFLNTFLLTYRVFTTGFMVLEALKRVYRNPEYGNIDLTNSQALQRSSLDSDDSQSSSSVRSSLDYTSQIISKEQQMLINIESDKQKLSFEKTIQDEENIEQNESITADVSDRLHPALTLLKPRLAPIASFETLCESFDFHANYDNEESAGDDAQEMTWLDSAMAAADVVNGNTSNSIEVASDVSEGRPSSDDVPTIDSSSHVTTSSDALIRRSLPFSGSDSRPKYASRHSSPCQSALASVNLICKKKASLPTELSHHNASQLDALALSPGSSSNRHQSVSDSSRLSLTSLYPQGTSSGLMRQTINQKERNEANKTKSGGKRFSTESDVSIRTSIYTSSRSSCTTTSDGPHASAKAGTVVTSSRASKRRSSSAAAAAAFAAATAASSNPKDVYMMANGTVNRFHTTSPLENKAAGLTKKRESAINSAATLRVLSILRHWVAKHSQDFERNLQLKSEVDNFLDEISNCPFLSPLENKALESVLQVLSSKDELMTSARVDLTELLKPSEVPSEDNFDTLSALDIAEQMTYLDHQIFMAICSEELLSQSWMKPDKAVRAPHILMVTKRFNEASHLVVSEIVRRQNVQDRATCIEKWAAICDICCCLHNYNGVLQICAAFVNSSVFRLKKTWEKVSKQSKQMIDKLQTVVSSDGRFKNMRDALHRCDPPSIPYLGLYLTDLSFIDEGTPTVTDDCLINFSKMRMIAHVIREVQHFQQTSYRIEHRPKVTKYLLDPSRLLEEDETYRSSLELEPRMNRLSSVAVAAAAAAAINQTT